MSLPVAEEMILLSRLIKWTPSSSSYEQTEKKIISIKLFKKDPEIDEPVLDHQNAEEQSSFIIHRAKAEAEELLKNANDLADKLRKELEEKTQLFEIEKEQIKTQAYKAGFDSGLDEGRLRGYSEYQESIAAAKACIDSSKEEYKTYLESSQSQILDLGLKVAQKIIGKTIQNDEDGFLSLVKNALKEAKDNKEIQLHVHPVQYDFLRANKEELVMLFPKEVDLFIYPNDELSELGCMIESENGRIDAGIDSQLEEIKRKLVEMLEDE